MKKISLFMALGLLLLSCQRNEYSGIPSTALMVDSINLTPPPPTEMFEMVKFTPPVIKDDAVEEEIQPASGQQNKSPKKIIKDGTISIRSEKIENAKKYLDKIVKKADAYYEKEEFSNGDSRTSYTLKIRIPSKDFESFVQATEKGKGEIMSKSINARDVTEVL